MIYLQNVAFNRTAYGIEIPVVGWTVFDAEMAFNRTAYGIEMKLLWLHRYTHRTFNRTAYGIEMGVPVVEPRMNVAHF